LASDGETTTKDKVMQGTFSLYFEHWCVIQNAFYNSKEIYFL